MKKIIFSAIGFVAIFGLGAVVMASHSWGDYHWARTSTPFTLQLGDKVSNTWDSYLATTSTDWTVSEVLNTTVATTGNTSSPRKCSPTSGRVEVCSEKYGNNGWLGLAQIWISGSHITQGAVKVNDTYFSMASYNTPAWRNLVMCQEVGHILGLGHNDGNMLNLNKGTCMDYTNDPARADGFGDNQHPNTHDYEQLVTIYGQHTDTMTTVAATLLAKFGFGSFSNKSRDDVDFGDSAEWGKTIKTDEHGKSSLYERDFGNGKKLHTFVIWAE